VNSLPSSGSFLRWFSISALLAAVVLTLLEMVAYSRERSNIPRGVTIGNVYVGGLSKEEASQLLLRVYSQPLEIHYQQNVFYLTPAQAGFSLDLETMLSAIEPHQSERPWLQDFWGFLWKSPATTRTIPLKVEYSEAQLGSALRDIAARYDVPASAPQAELDTASFNAGLPGTTLNQEHGLELLIAALQSVDRRVVILPIASSSQRQPPIRYLSILIKQIANQEQFDGVLDLVNINLQTGQEIHILSNSGEDIPANPDVAFSALSTIKIPIMVATYLSLDQAPDSETNNWIKEMITLSGNDPSDWLMERFDKNLGPKYVTEMLFKLGLKNSFIGSYYYPGATALLSPKTLANSRTDISTHPDVFNQTTPYDMSMLLEDIYLCSHGGGSLPFLFSGKITQDECIEMLNWLSQDPESSLVKAGVPDGTRVDHKHGWGGSTIGDAAIVYSPGGNYVLTVYLWRDGQLIVENFDKRARLIARISKAIYNYYNPPG
jgi:beta-lactamase class A